MKRQHLHVWTWWILHEDRIVSREVKLCFQLLHIILTFENAQLEEEGVENAHFAKHFAQRTFSHHRMSIHVQNCSCIVEKISHHVEMSSIIRTDDSRNQLKHRYCSNCSFFFLKNYQHIVSVTSIMNK